VSERVSSVERLVPRRWLLTALSLLCLAAFLFPIYWMILTSVRPRTETFAYPPHLVPGRLDFAGWSGRVLSDGTIMRYFLNSAIVASGTTLLTLALAAPAAHALAHLRLRGNSLLLMLSLMSLMFPAVMLATPLFVIFSRLHLTDSYLGLVLANTTQALPFAIVVLRPFFRSIPAELSDAALVDGCTRWGAFVRIVLPLGRPGLLTTAVFTFLFAWSDLVFALSLTTSDSLRPVTAGLWNFMGSNVTAWNSVMAFSTLAMLPPLVVFLIAQRYVIAGLTTRWPA
jgi:multiple sugar transport system permease protein